MTEEKIIQIYEDILSGKQKKFFNFWNKEDSLQKAIVLLRYLVKKLEIPDEEINFKLTHSFLQQNKLDGITRIFAIDDIITKAFPHIKRIRSISTEQSKKRHSEKIKNLSDDKWDRIKFGIRNNRYTKEYGKKLSETKQGELNHIAVLKEKDIPTIRQLFGTGNYSTTVLGEMFGVKRQTIRDVVTYRTWKHVK